MTDWPDTMLVQGFGSLTNLGLRGAQCVTQVVAGPSLDPKQFGLSSPLRLFSSSVAAAPPSSSLSESC
jgi:hypothetical protein